MMAFVIFLFEINVNELILFLNKNKLSVNHIADGIVQCMLISLWQDIL